MISKMDNQQGRTRLDQKNLIKFRCSGGSQFAEREEERKCEIKEKRYGFLGYSR
jgi:hypothetical protein